MMTKQPYKTDLPVLLPASSGKPEEKFRIKLWHGFALFGFCMLSTEYVFADEAQAQASALSTLIKWMPLLLTGFIFNIVISFCAMALSARFR